MLQKMIASLEVGVGDVGKPKPSRQSGGQDRPDQGDSGTYSGLSVLTCEAPK